MMATISSQNSDQKLLTTMKELRSELVASNIKLAKTISEATNRMVHQCKICTDLEKAMEEIDVS